MINCHLNLLTMRDLNGEQAGRNVIEILERSCPVLLPQRYGNYEPLKLAFQASNLATVLRHWKFPFLWKRTKPTVEGSVWMAPAGRLDHSTVAVQWGSKNLALDSSVQLLQNWSIRLDADFAFIHQLNEQEIIRGTTSGVVHSLNRKGTKYIMFLPKHRLRKSIPDLYWATVFGPPYVELIGIDKLLSAPAAIVRQISKEMVYLQLMQNSHDMTKNYSFFEKTRANVKAHLGEDLFFDRDRGDGFIYRVPTFADNRGETE